MSPSQIAYSGEHFECVRPAALSAARRGCPVAVWPAHRQGVRKAATRACPRPSACSGAAEGNRAVFVKPVAGAREERVAKTFQMQSDRSYSDTLIALTARGCSFGGGSDKNCAVCCVSTGGARRRCPGRCRYTCVVQSRESYFHLLAEKYLNALTKCRPSTQTVCGSYRQLERFFCLCHLRWCRWPHSGEA